MTTLEKIKKEISENQKVISETLSLDKENEFYNGKWAGFELALAIIDKYASEECDRDCEHCAYLECPKEPCEDAVSRQAVLKEFEKGTENLYGRIDKLPSVNPQPCDYAISRADVISVINILADKMDESGKTAAEQFISAIKDMR